MKSVWPRHPTRIRRIQAVAEHLPRGVRVALLALLSLGLAACAAPAARRALVPVAVRVVAFPRASGTVEALARQPYLRVQAQAAEALLQARARVPGRPGGADPRARAAVALRRAREAYQGLRLPEALEGLAGALAELASAAALEAEDLRLLRELLLQRALCELALSRVVDAQASIAAAMALGFDGSQAGAYSPEVEAVIDGVRRQRVGGGHQALTVTARPAEALVLIDGRRVGPAPVTVKLGAGPHLLRAERRGFRPFARWWTAPAGGGALQRLELVLEAASVGETAAELLAGLHAAGGASAGDPELLARVVGPERAIVTVTGQAPQLSSRLIWTGLPETSPTIRACRGTDGRALAGCLGPALYTLASGQPFAEDAPRAAVARPLYRRWWFWTLVAAGGGVAALVVAGANDHAGVNVDLRAPR